MEKQEEGERHPVSPSGRLGIMGHLGSPRGNWWFLGTTDRSKGASMVPWGKLGQMTVTGAPKGTVGVLGKMEESGRVSGATRESAGGKAAWRGPGCKGGVMEWARGQ